MKGDSKKSVNHQLYDSGIIAGIIGGTVIGYLSGSNISVICQQFADNMLIE